MPKKKRGRFIPCRGGGTATTYYMVWHDVDEDLRTGVRQGGEWRHGTGSGIARRGMDVNTSPTNTLDIVASRLIYLS